ncbi:hypothetical protein [Kineococcus rubinsiae]|uniref:hypothetical protein n=1 Tax=Kineococcus rubinsiae TaxID=2609562 RepID=UPI001430EB4E|nr:hypothetical protein [Kineococcus rubinsiae]NIZ91023.1 hypothetical protein [Kineococcus rubinsiae]
MTAPRCSRLLTASSLLAVATLLAGCGSDDATEPAAASPSASSTSASTSPTSSASSTSAASPTSSAPSSSSSTADGTPDAPGAGGGTGCAPNGAEAPAGAGTAVTGDVDLDGEADTVWLADTPDRTLGITTASGATFSTTFTSAAPQAASSLGQKLQPAGPAIVLLNTGRSVALYAVVDCALVPTQNAEGEQYTFDLGFTGYGTGVGCVAGGDEEDLQLAGLDAEDTGGGTFRVTRTAVELSDSGRRAANGATTVVAEGLAADDPRVENARTVGCGNQAEGADEPQ